ncbi:MAG: peptide ABC transporter substrate-binding protein [Pseudomonadota bacterium]
MKHLQTKSISSFAAALAVCTMLAGAAEARVLNVHNGGDISSLDPHKVSGDWENRVVGDVFEGLVTEDINAQPIPGMAESWEISDDGLVYTFKLREGAVWSDGEPVKASDFVFAFQRLLDPETAADYAYLQYTVKNAEAINKGDIADFGELGVVAIDDKTVEFTLDKPAPYFLSALTHYTAYPIPEHAIEEHGDDWVRVENIVVNGPYKPTEWIPGSHVLTAINDSWYDADSLAVEGVKFFTLEDESAALKRYRAGEFDILTEFPTDQYGWLQDNRPGEARVAPFAGLYYYSINTSKEPFTDPKVRQALSMSINREVIGPSILGTGEIPAYSWVPPGMANYNDMVEVSWKDMEYGEKVEQAKALLTEAGFGPDNPLSLQLRYNTNENHKRIAVAVAAMWKPLGVEVELYNTETKVHYDELTKGVLDVARAGWLADYNDADNFLNLLKTDVPFNYGRWSNGTFDALLDEANTITDLDARAAKLREAEQLALDDSASIPIYYYISRNVVQPYVKGFEDNVFDIHRTRWLSIEE